jgi:hypothetical protein
MLWWARVATVVKKTIVMTYVIGNGYHNPTVASLDSLALSLQSLRSALQACSKRICTVMVDGGGDKRIIMIF